MTNMIAMRNRWALCILLASVLGSSAAAEPAGGPPDGAVADEIEQVFEGPVDFTVPPPTRAIDPSRFTAGRNAWDGKVGVDAGSGAAWANLTGSAAELPGTWDKAAVATRIDPQQQGKLGVTLSRSVPVGDVSMTWQNGYAVSQALGSGAAAGGQQAYSTDQSVRVEILPDTTLSVGASISSADDKWTRSLSAEQKLFGGPISVTGAVSEGAGGDLSKRLKAGFKRTW
jgi:hypothetical protein